VCKKILSTENCIQSYAPMACLLLFLKRSRDCKGLLHNCPCGWSRLWIQYERLCGSGWHNYGLPLHESTQTTEWCWYIYIYVYLYFLFFIEFLKFIQSNQDLCCCFPPICTWPVFDLCTNKWKGLTLVRYIMVFFICCYW